MPEDAKPGEKDRKPKPCEDTQQDDKAAVVIEAGPVNVPEDADNLRRRAEWFQRRRSKES